MDWSSAQTVCGAVLLTSGMLWWLQQCLLARQTALRERLCDPQDVVRRRCGKSLHDESYVLLLPPPSRHDVTP